MTKKSLAATLVAALACAVAWFLVAQVSSLGGIERGLADGVGSLAGSTSGRRANAWTPGSAGRPMSAAVTSRVAKPWASSIDAWNRGDFRSLIAGAKERPDAGSYSYATRVAFHCLGVLGYPGDKKGDAMARVLADADKDPGQLALRQASAKALVDRCSFMTREEWASLRGELLAEEPTSGDALGVISRKAFEAAHCRGEMSEQDRRQAITDAILSGEPRLLQLALSAFQGGGEIAGQRLSPGMGSPIDPNLSAAVALIGCANHGVCGLKQSLDEDCAYLGRCNGENVFSTIQGSLSPERWQAVNSLYLSLQGAIASGNPDALGIILPPRPAQQATGARR